MSITKDKILDLLTSEEQAPSTEYDSCISDVANRQVGSLISRLVAIDEEEEGGRTAITGFFYQMLIGIEYMIQMIQGNWDFVALELHDDIVAGKDKHIRFVQVKSSKYPHQKVSETGLYGRSSFKKDEEIFYYNDSWADKLLRKSHHFPVTSGYKCEFELATSYHLVEGSSKTDVSLYNEEFPVNIPVDDVLLNKLKSLSFDKNLSQYSYEDVCGESLQSLLTKFRIKKYSDSGNKIFDYMENIQSKFGALISENTRLSRADLHQLIAHLLDRCLIRNGKSMLYLTRQDAIEIKDEYKARIRASFGQEYRCHDSLEVIKNVFSEVHAECSVKHELYAEMKSELYRCHDALTTWIDEEPGDIEMLLSLYGHGTRRTLNLQPVERDKRLLTLIRGNVFLNIVNSSTTKIILGNKSLLLKAIGNKHVSFLHVERRQTFDNGCEKLQTIIKSVSSEEQVSLMSKKPITIIDGHRDDIEVSKFVYIASPSIQLDKLGQDSDLVKPFIEFQAIPGKYVQKLYDDSLYDLDSLDEIRDAWKNAFVSIIGGSVTNV